MNETIASTPSGTPSYGSRVASANSADWNMTAGCTAHNSRRFPDGAASFQLKRLEKGVRTLFAASYAQLREKGS
jgi:hypothetical protein